MKVKIVNVVATGSLNHPVILNKLSPLTEVTYNPQRYGGRVAYFKTHEMEGKVSIFCSGKLISVGTKSEEQAKKELQLTKQFLVEKGLIKELKLEPKTQNIVATAGFEIPINLEELPQKTRAIYEPEQFPGAILRIIHPFKTSVLVFASGKVVITGLKSQSDIEPTVRALKDVIAFES